MQARDTTTKNAENSSSTSSPDTAAEDLVARMREYVRRRVTHKELSLDAAARDLGTHRRTLQRRLARSGTTFREELDHARRDVTLQLLAEGRPYADIAKAAGLVGPTSLHRTFRRWFGMTMGQYKARQRDELIQGGTSVR